MTSTLRDRRALSGGDLSKLGPLYGGQLLCSCHCCLRMCGLIFQISNNENQDFYVDSSHLKILAIDFFLKLVLFSCRCVDQYPSVWSLDQSHQHRLGIPPNAHCQAQLSPSEPGSAGRGLAVIYISPPGRDTRFPNTAWNID